MIDINTSALALGFAIGLPMSALFFWGLNWGMRMALVSPYPARVLLLSFFCRLVLLLTIGFSLTTLTDSLWSLAGYMLAYVLVRVIAVMRAQLNQGVTVPKQERV